jgi:succinate dehydrogenase / fumarate reductase, flavoprotein subunit
VFGTRCAEHIAAQAGEAGTVDELALVAAAKTEIEAGFNAASPITAEALRDEIQPRMSDGAGMICDVAQIRDALAGARRLNAAIAAQGVAADGAAEALRAVQWRHMALASEAVLTALAFYVERGGGSRGARVICDPAGACVPKTRTGPLQAYRFRPERAGDAREQIHVRRDGSTFAVSTAQLRAKPGGERPFFEANWPDYLTGAIYGEPR